MPPGVEDRSFGLENGGLENWARANRCLFTIVDHEAAARAVIEFEPEFSEVVDLADLERRQRLPVILAAQGVLYLCLSRAELEEVLRPDSHLDIALFLSDKFEALNGRRR